MTAAATPGRDELARDLALAFHGDEIEWRGFLSKAALILSNQSTRLAANPSSDPDAMNERRAVEDAKLAENVREAVLTEIGRSDDKVAREALKPFADAASYYDDANLSPGEHPWRDDDTANPVFSVRQLRAARKALSTMGEPKSC